MGGPGGVKGILKHHRLRRNGPQRRRPPDRCCPAGSAAVLDTADGEAEVRHSPSRSMASGPGTPRWRWRCSRRCRNPPAGQQPVRPGLHGHPGPVLLRHQIVEGVHQLLGVVRRSGCRYWYAPGGPSPSGPGQIPAGRRTGAPDPPGPSARCMESVRVPSRSRWRLGCSSGDLSEPQHLRRRLHVGLREQAETTATPSRPQFFNSRILS